MKNKWVFFLFLLFIIPLAIAQTSTDENLTITITADGKAKVSHTLFPATYLSSINVETVSGDISKILATDEKNVLLGTKLDGNSLKIISLGASKVNLSYEADIISYESGIFKVKYQNSKESTLVLPPLSNVVGLNVIPKDIKDKTFKMLPGSITLSYSVREVDLQNFDVSYGGISHPVELMTGAKISDFKGNENEISFLVEEKSTILAIIPNTLFDDIKDTTLNGGMVDFKAYYENATHSWIRIDPHENGLVKISSNFEKDQTKDPQTQETITIDARNEEGGGCLIATATFGSEMASQVQALREIRDTKVMSTVAGRTFMTGFNQMYYSFSPQIADLERQNPIFKESVKIIIAPMLASLSVLSNTDIKSEQDILGYGVIVIIMNVGMYLILPVLLFYWIKTVRTRRNLCSNRLIIFNSTTKKHMNKSLFGIIALFVLLISIPTAMSQIYAQTAEDDTGEPEMTPMEQVLLMTKNNAEAALESSGEESTSAQALFELGMAEYQKALASLDEDPQAAQEYAITAMALFEDTSSLLGVLEESRVLEQLPPGFGSAVGSTSDTNNGQGLGVGGIPQGQLKKLDASTIFTVSEDINDSEEEGAGLKSLLLENNFNVDSTGYDEAINLAKAALANGDIPTAQAKLAIANNLLEELFAQMNDLASDPENNDERINAFAEKTIAEIKSLLENGNKIGLTQNTINELQATLEILESGNAEWILAATSEDANLAKELKEVNKAEETEQKVENKAEEKAVREENKADEKELRESDPEAAQQLKVDNKEAEKEQKAENKAEEKAVREENKAEEKALRDYLKLISTNSYFSYDDEWEEEPTESDYNDVTDTPTDKDLKKQLKAEAKALKDAEKAAKKAQKQDDKDRKDKNNNGKGNGNSGSCPAGQHWQGNKCKDD